MPYKAFKENDKWCLHKMDGTVKGALVPGGCHDSPDKARKHQQALYAAESGGDGKSIDAQTDCQECLQQEPSDVKMYNSYGEPMVWGAKSFAEFEAAESANDTALEMQELSSQFQCISGNILSDEMMSSEEKATALSMLVEDYKSRITSSVETDQEEEKEVHKSLLDKIVSAVKAAISGDTTDKQEDLCVWKSENGQYHWIARYSNKFRDNDHPREIISEASHSRFNKMVNDGVVPMPELWIWHKNSLRIGKAVWHAYDDSGFAMAGGYFDKDAEEVAKAVQNPANKIRLSHGMYKSTIKRDEQDPTVIVEHITHEISLLPKYAAANKMTGFLSYEKEDQTEKDAKMAIPDKERKTIEGWGVPADVLAAIEARNSQDSGKAVEIGVESKEQEPPAAVPAAAEASAVIEPVEPESVDELETATAEPVAAAAEPEQQDPEKAIKALVELFGESIAVLNKRLGGIESMVVEIKDADDEKVKAFARRIPSASITAMLSERAVGSPDARLKATDKLASAQPEENENTNIRGSRYPSPFIAKMLSGLPAEQGN